MCFKYFDNNLCLILSKFTRLDTKQNVSDQVWETVNFSPGFSIVQPCPLWINSKNRRVRSTKELVRWVKWPKWMNCVISIHFTILPIHILKSILIWNTSSAFVSQWFLIFLIFLFPYFMAVVVFIDSIQPGNEERKRGGNTAEKGCRLELEPEPALQGL